MLRTLFEAHRERQDREAEWRSLWGNTEELLATLIDVVSVGLQVLNEQKKPFKITRPNAPKEPDRRLSREGMRRALLGG